MLVGHSYIRRLGQYMENRHYRNLRLSDVDVVVAGYGGATVDRLRSCLSGNIVDDADVIFLHIGQNDYQQQSTVVTA